MIDASPPPAPATPAASPLRSIVWEIVETILLTAAIYLVVNFATGRFKVEGTSMEPNVHPGDYVLVDKLSYPLSRPQRGDVMVFNYPQAAAFFERDFIKRIIGLPGETVTLVHGQVLINDQALAEPYIKAPAASSGTWVLGPDQYFVMGDNRGNSSDSRSWGALERKYFIGKAVLTYWPVDHWGWVTHYTYGLTP